MPEISEELSPEEADYFLKEEEAEQFKDLLIVGRLSRTYKVYGHKIRLETTTVDEDIQVGLIVKPFMDSYAFERAYRTAMVAAYVKEIDDKPLIQSLTIRETESTSDVSIKFEKLKEYYPSVIDEIFIKVKELDSELLPILSRLGKTLS